MDVLTKTVTGRSNQILASEIQATGRYPVIDQGQKFIAGYSDDDSRVIRNGLPVVIFGDHTRCLKYVDFPFVIGADGTKVLKPNPQEFNELFFYFALKGLDIPNRGYNRHFSLLREARIPCPSVPEQRKIAAVLGLVQRAIEQQERLIALTTELKQALLHKLMTEGTRGEPQKATEIGPIPESWRVTPLRTVCRFLSGGTPSKRNIENWKGDIPWVSPKDMKKPRLSDALDHISDAGLRSGSKLAPTGALFVVVRGMILAKDIPVALAEVPMAFNQDMKAIIPGNALDSEFLLYALESRKRNLLRKVGRSAHGTATLLSSEVEGLLIPHPDLATQCEIALVLSTIDKKHELELVKSSRLAELFRTFLHQLMTAQIRVTDLDLSALDGALTD